MRNSIKNKKKSINKNKTIKKITGPNVIGQVRKKYKNMLALTNASERPNLYRLFSESRLDKLKKMSYVKNLIHKTENINR